MASEIHNPLPYISFTANWGVPSIKDMTLEVSSLVITSGMFNFLEARIELICFSRGSFNTFYIKTPARSLPDFV